eukprot:TRINITY_DN17307_c0_g1_i1.p1 TRINITY_DN17307_c0_g1~~TRINITY_DN17307_c0_g1_i1.p1  ORF type:complete len:288 (+),score=43.76 TRINITY_DN17307_c0_g1_i1:121-984(+)
MASAISISQSHLFSNEKTHFKTPKTLTSHTSVSLRNSSFQSMAFRRNSSVQIGTPVRNKSVIVSATTAEKPKKRYPGEAKGFVEEMRFVAMKLHTRDQAKEGEKESNAQPIAKWEPSIQGYLRFLVDSKVVYDTLETIVQKAAHPSYAVFRNTGLERSEKLAKDLDWFKEQGHAIPEPSLPGTSYSRYLEDLSENDPQAFICHFYNVYFAHSAGGRMIGKKVAEKILDNKELQFYKWDGDLSQLLQNVREKLNRVAEGWSREEKNRCLEETEKSFKYSGEILRLILT